MDGSFDRGEAALPSLARHISPDAVNVDLTMCGLLADRAEELARLYRTHGNWNDVERVWFDDRRSDRSTKDSSQKIFRVLTSRLKNAPPSLPNASDLPLLLDTCTTPRDRAQVLYLYLVEDDAVVRYVVHEYVNRLVAEHPTSLDFSNETLRALFDKFESTDGERWEYAASTTERWCEGLRSVLRNVGVLESQKAVVGAPPALGDVPLLTAIGYSYEEGSEDWLETPPGLLRLFQPPPRWEELYDRAAATDAWEYVETHGTLELRPRDDAYSWIDERSEP